MRNFTFDPSTSDIMDSRDLIERLEELRAKLEEVRATNEDPSSGGAAMDEDERQELEDLEALAKECEGYGAWEHGETIIPRDAFVDHITELIDDCYEMPKDMNSGKWPFCHMTMNYEAAAQEAETDYMSVMVRGHEFLMRA